MTGILRTTHTPPHNMRLALYFHISSPTTSGLRTRLLLYSPPDIRVYPSLPLLNFLGLLLLAVQRGSADTFRQLVKHYEPYIKDIGTWDEALAQIGEIYFGIRIPKQSNPFMDMVGNMFFGGGGSQRSSTPKPKPKTEATPPPIDLD
jgi:hypothetical protein